MRALSPQACRIRTDTRTDTSEESARAGQVVGVSTCFACTFHRRDHPPIGALQCYCSPTSRALPVSGTIAIRCHTLCCAPGDTTRVTTWGDSRHDSLYITSPIPSVRRRRLVQSCHPLSLARMPSLATAGQHSRRFMNEGTPRSWDIRVPCRQLQTQTPILLNRERRPTLARDS